MRVKRTMDSIRALGVYMTAQETELLKQRTCADTLAFAFRSFWLTAAGLGLLLLVLVLQERAVDRGIQARDRLVDELDQASEKLKVTLLSIGDAVIACDEKGRITLMNSVAEDLTGWQLAEAGGQLVETVFNIVNEETRLLVENPATKALRTGKPVELANHTVLIGKQGQETHIDDIGAPIRDRQNQILGVVLVFRDVGRRRAQELQIDKWHRIFQHAGFGVAIVSNDGNKILEVNQTFARMHGYQPEELRDKPVRGAGRR